MCQCHGYQSFLIIIQLNIYAQTHTEKFVSITKISAYKLDKHAVICCQKLKLKVRDAATGEGLQGASVHIRNITREDRFTRCKQFSKFVLLCGDEL